MRKRNPIAVIILSILTFGLYGLYWFVSTKGEMNRLGASIPTALFIIIPIVNIWWYWKYSEGVEKVTNANLSGVLAFILLILAGSIGSGVIQDFFNKVENKESAAPIPL